MRKHASLFFAALLLSLVFCGAGLARNDKTISAKEAHELLVKNPGGIYVLDVRTQGEFKKGHLPGAHNMDFWGPTFDSDIMKLPKDKKILLYCRTGKRSAGAMEQLEKEGFIDVAHMASGLEDWQKSGFDLEKSGADQPPR